MIDNVVESERSQEVVGGGTLAYSEYVTTCAQSTESEQ